MIWRGNGGEGTLPFFHRPSVLDDRLLVPVGRDDRALLALRKADGSLIWRSLLQGDRPGSKVYYGFDSSCLPYGEAVFCGSPDGCLYAVSGSDGDILWRSCTGGGVLGGPLIVNDLLVFGSCDRNVYAIDPKTGDPQWSVALGGEVWDTPVVEGSYLLMTALDLAEDDSGDSSLCALRL